MSSSPQPAAPEAAEPVQRPAGPRRRPGPPRVLMLWSGHRPGPWTGRALARCGMGVIAGHPDDGSPGWAPPGAPLLRYPRPEDDPEGFLDWTERTCEAHGVDAVVTLAERVVSLLSRRAPTIGGARVVGPDAAQYRALCDKGVLPDTCALAGVAHPATVIVSGTTPLPVALPDLPNVIKPREADGIPPQVPCAVVARTPAEREEAIRVVLDGGCTAVVQRMVEGEQWGVYTASLGDRTVGVAARVLTTAPRSAGTPSRFLIGHGQAPFLDAAARLLDSVGYLGVANLDVIRVGDSIHVLDVNLRPAASAALPELAGLDLAPMCVAAALGLPVPRTRPQTPFTYVSLEGELGVLMRESGRGAVLAGLAGAAVRRDVHLDPPLSDVRWLARTAAKVLGR